MKPLDLLHPLSTTPTPKLTVGCPLLDRFLHGGLPSSTITELVAESGTGKTQLCLQLLLTSQYPPSPSPLSGLSGSSIYLHSEFPFPYRRLFQLSLQHPYLQNPLNNIFVKSLYSAYHLLDVLPELEKFISRAVAPPRLPVKLVVIDSVAALFRSEFENNLGDLRERSRLFFEISSKLKGIGRKYGVVIVVTNQVVDVMEDSGGSGEECLVSSGRRVAPALGLAWTHCVNVRLFLWRREERLKGEGEGVEFETRRFIRVVFAPHLPDSCCQFVIKREGIVGVDG